MNKKMEKKIIESVNECDVPSLEAIKSRIDFSKNPPVRKEKVFFNKKLVYAFCVVSLILSITLSIVAGFDLINNKYNNDAYYMDDVLSDDELEYIESNYSKINKKPYFVVSLDYEVNLIIYQAANKYNANIICYIYKYIDYGRNNQNAIIHINNQDIIIDENNTCGLLYEVEKDKTALISFEVTIREVTKQYSFTH